MTKDEPITRCMHTAGKTELSCKGPGCMLSIAQSLPEADAEPSDYPKPWTFKSAQAHVQWSNCRHISMQKAPLTSYRIFISREPLAAAAAAAVDAAAVLLAAAAGSDCGALPIVLLLLLALVLPMLPLVLLYALLRASSPLN